MHALSTLPLSKQLLMYSQPYFLMGLRMTVAGLVLLLYSYARQQRPIIDKTCVNLYARIMLFAIFLPYCLRYWALAQQNTQFTTLLYNSGPFITYACAIVYGVETVNRMSLMGLIFGICGVLIQQGVSVSSYLNAPYGLAEIALLASIVSFCYGWICIRHVVVDMKQEPVQVNAITMLGGGILGLCASLLFEKSPYMICVGTAIPLLATVILISNCITHTLYATLLRTYSLTFIQYVGLCMTLCIQITRALYNGEQLHLMPLFSCICIGVGFLMLYANERKNIGVASAKACTEKIV
jgi:drug/metabolite transporter (DMT)-like permease